MELNSYIDHTLLKPDATYAQIETVRQSPYIQLPSMVVLICNIAYLFRIVKTI